MPMGQVSLTTLSLLRMTLLFWIRRNSLVSRQFTERLLGAQTNPAHEGTVLAALRA